MSSDWTAEVREILVHAADEDTLRQQLEDLCITYDGGGDNANV